MEERSDSDARVPPIGTVDDAALVARCRAGEENAWSELVERFSRYVYVVAVQGFRLPEADAEDIFQEVFTRTYERIDQLRDDGAMRPWLIQLTRRLCLDSLRRAACVTPAEDMDLVLSDQQVAIHDRLDEALSVHVGLASLSEECQEILDRFFARDESYLTISKELGIPQGTIASRISRCLTKLRKQLAN